MFYAEIDKKGKCFAVSDMEEIEKPTLIRLGENTDVLGKIWNGEKWIEEVEQPEPQEPPEPPIPEPTEQELLNAEFLLNQTEQFAKLNTIDETLAVLLLNSTGGM